MLEEIRQKIQDADYVLIGLGEEWTYSELDMLKDYSYLEERARIKTEEEITYYLPLLKKKYFSKFHDERIKQAYSELYEMLKDKEYFLVSTNLDRYPLLSGLSEEKCVFPCGGYELLQCDHEDCSKDLYKADVLFRDFNFDCLNESINTFPYPCCNTCHDPLVFNNVYANHYNENGYLYQWDKYKSFLQKTINHKLCVLELGVSLKYPTVIRKAFETTVYFNKKSQFIRVHEEHAQVDEKIKERMTCYMENSVDFILK